jgi:hypothetical protein
MPRKAFEPTTPVSERVKTAHASDSVATVISQRNLVQIEAVLKTIMFASASIAFLGADPSGLAV